MANPVKAAVAHEAKTGILKRMLGGLIDEDLTDLGVLGALAVAAKVIVSGKSAKEGVQANTMADEALVAALILLLKDFAPKGEDIERNLNSLFTALKARHPSYAEQLRLFVVQKFASSKEGFERIEAIRKELSDDPKKFDGIAKTDVSLGFLLDLNKGMEQEKKDHPDSDQAAETMAQHVIDHLVPGTTLATMSGALKQVPDLIVELIQSPGFVAWQEEMRRKRESTTTHMPLLIARASLVFVTVCALFIVADYLTPKAAPQDPLAGFVTEAQEKVDTFINKLNSRGGVE